MKMRPGVVWNGTKSFVAVALVGGEIVWVGFSYPTSREAIRAARKYIKKPLT